MKWKLKSHNVNPTTQVQEVCTTALHCMHQDNTLAMHAEFGVIHFVLPWWCAAGRELLGDHTLEKLLVSKFVQHSESVFSEKEVKD